MGKSAPRAFAAVLLVAEIASAASAGSARFGAHESLDDALVALAAEKRVPLLYDRRLVSGHKAGTLDRDLPFEQALAEILLGTGLTATRSPAGVYTISRSRMGVEASRIEPQPQSKMISDILVVGHATNNVDLPRSEDDIQPYQILTSDRIDSSLAHTTGELLSEQVTMNLGTPAGLTSSRQVTRNSVGSAIPGSYVDLNGFGTDQSLVLVDGRRMPGVPGSQSFPQADISAITPVAIDRVETLGLTAGAIFGVGATGGVLNVVLKHDYRGFDLNILNGISQRGDDARRVVEAKAGFETSDGRTKGMIRVGYSQFGGDLVGARAVGTERAALLEKLYPSQIFSVVANVVLIQSIDGEDLRFKPAYGGSSLRNTITTLPLTALPFNTGAIALLKADAGQPIASLSPDGAGALASLQQSSTTLSIMTSLRQAVGDRIQLFADALFLRDETHSALAGATNEGDYSSEDDYNPFENDIVVFYPTPGIVGGETDRRTTNRVTLGAIWHIGRGWSADADFTFGRSTLTSRTSDAFESEPNFNILAPDSNLLSHVDQLKVVPDAYAHGSDRLYDGNVRIAGPLFSLPGGTANATATGEWREDRNPGLFQAFAAEDGSFEGSAAPNQRTAVASGFIELQLPMLPTSSGFILTRGLKLQLAARHDRYSIVVPNSGNPLSSNFADVFNHDAVTSLTLGGSMEPISGFMLRASYATGYEPPSPAQLFQRSDDIILPEFCDLERGGCASFDNGTFKYVEGGNPKAKAQRSQSLSIGFIMKPSAVPGLRVSLDYDRLLITHALTSFYDSTLGLEYLLAHQADYPDRVIRAPLTATDRALGYTVGKLEEINVSLFNNGRTTVKTISGSFAYQHAIASGLGAIYGRVTWEPRFSKTTDPGAGPHNLVGIYDGPLKARAVGGISWQRGPVTIAVDGQYYGSYSTASIDIYGDTDRANAQHVASKVYLDLALDYTASIGRSASTLRYRLAVRNLLDKQPSPIASNDDSGTIADPYGDFIGRRFEFSVSARF